VRAIVSIAGTLLLGSALTVAGTATGIAKHGKPWRHFHGQALVRWLPAPSYSEAPPPAEAATAVPHADWCARMYQTYDADTDTNLRYDGIRVGCGGP
jgi:hypothetical protein